MTPEPKNNGSIRVGFISGFNSPYGIVVKNQFKGAQLAVEEMNKTGGILEKSIELIERDDEMKPDLAEKVAKELIEKEQVHLIVGTLSSATATRVNEVAKAAGIPMMVINQVNITDAKYFGPYTFHGCVTPYITSQLVGRWGLENLGKRWFFIIPDYQWGYESYESSHIVMERLGGTDLGVAKIPLGAKIEDFEKHIPEILKAKPDVLAVTNFGGDQINFIKAAHKAGLKKEMSIVLGISDTPIVDEVSMDELVGMYWGVNFYWGLEDHIPTAKKFVSGFRKRFNGDLPSGYAGYAYSGMIEFLTAANQAPGNPIDYDAMAKFLEGRTYDHYKGKQWWRPCDHQSFQDFYILRFKGPEESTQKYDIGEILGTVTWDLDIARTCEELGHGKNLEGHFK